MTSRKIIVEQFGLGAKTYSGSANRISDSRPIGAHVTASDRQPPGHVLEFCCGTVMVGRRFQSVGWSVCGIDLTAKMAREANLYYLCICASAEAVPFLDGPLATAIPRLLLQATKVDFVVAGEGEVTITELPDSLTGNPWALPVSEILGLTWRDESAEIRTKPARPQREDLDALPFQDFFQRVLKQLHLLLPCLSASEPKIRREGEEGNRLLQSMRI